jgi:hypothetical protein
MRWVKAGFSGVVRAITPIGVAALGLFSACGGSTTTQNECSGRELCATGGTVGTQEMCTPRTQGQCSGPDGCLGTRFCREDGQGFGPCLCASQGTGGFGGSTGAGGSGSGAGGSGTGAAAGTGPTDGGISPDAACASLDIEPGQVDLFVMLDQSGSMVLTGDRWSWVTSALRTFSQSPEAQGLGVGIGYFPAHPAGMPPVDPTSPGSCNPSDYARPDVPIGVLPAAALTIVESLGRRTPAGGTPMLPALQGAIMYASQWRFAHPGSNTLVVLITDGEPQGCTGNDLAAVTRAAAMGAAANPPILTHVIDVGNVRTLDPVAQAGGSPKAHVVQSSDQLVDALEEISGRAANCEFLLPAAAPNFDFSKISVIIRPAGGTDAVIAPVAGPQECSAETGGWYVESRGANDAIVLCPATCSKMNGLARVTIAIGCGDPPPP